MILENNYSHASDVWAFGILAWELYSAFASGQDKRGYSLPYCDLAIDQVGIKLLNYLLSYGSNKVES